MENIDINAELKRLEEKIDSLTSLCERLRGENQSLKTRYETWANERAQLVEKTAIAKNRVESMISRLKSLGHET
ncbi:MAG TPA: TIGR02449 family protein [Methylococcaceae bacterium]|jgi:cell division protein ZapB|nr:TIGR02449 family protein [Methylococcaceae bacterium]